MYLIFKDFFHLIVLEDFESQMTLFSGTTRRKSRKKFKIWLESKMTLSSSSFNFESEMNLFARTTRRKNTWSQKWPLLGNDVTWVKFASFIGGEGLNLYYFIMWSFFDGFAQRCETEKPLDRSMGAKYQFRLWR